MAHLQFLYSKYLRLQMALRMKRGSQVEKFRLNFKVVSAHLQAIDINDRGLFSAFANYGYIFL